MRTVENLKNREIVLDLAKRSRLQFTAIVACPHCDAEDVCEDAEFDTEYQFDYRCRGCGREVEGSFTVGIMGYQATAKAPEKKARKAKKKVEQIDPDGLQ